MGLKTIPFSIRRKKNYRVPLLFDESRLLDESLDDDDQRWKNERSVSDENFYSVEDSLSRSNFWSVSDFTIPD